MKVYKVIFEDYRDPSNIVEEIQYVAAENIGHVWESMGAEGLGYDKEMKHILEVSPVLRILLPYKGECE